MLGAYLFQVVPRGYNLTHYGFYTSTIWYHGVARQLFIASAVSGHGAFSATADAKLGKINLIWIYTTCRVLEKIVS